MAKKRTSVAGTDTEAQKRAQTEEYTTLGGEGRSEYTEKKSVFIGRAKHVKTTAEAVEFVRAVRAAHTDARHNVYAYLIASENATRYSDDGEPQGTAGMPVLDAIRKQEIVDVVVVVTRYFGGTLLGTGGLVHTYGASAKQGLIASKIVKRQLCDIVSVKVENERATTFNNVLIRVDPSFTLEMHIDTDEANAAEIRTGMKAEIVKG